MPSRAYGFTLLELIIIIVLLGIISALFAPFIGPALTRSHAPIDNLHRGAQLSSTMAQIIAVHAHHTDCDALRTAIGEAVTDTAFPQIKNPPALSIGYFNAGASFTFTPCHSKGCSYIYNPHLLRLTLQDKQYAGISLSYYFICTVPESIEVPS